EGHGPAGSDGGDEGLEAEGASRDGEEDEADEGGQSEPPQWRCRGRQDGSRPRRLAVAGGGPRRWGGASNSGGVGLAGGAGGVAGESHAGNPPEQAGSKTGVSRVRFSRRGAHLVGAARRAGVAPLRWRGPARGRTRYDRRVLPQRGGGRACDGPRPLGTAPRS